MACSLVAFSPGILDLPRVDFSLVFYCIKCFSELPQPYRNYTFEIVHVVVGILGPNTELTEANCIYHSLYVCM